MLKENLTRVKQRIEFACAKAGRSPGKITLVAVSKGRTIEQMREAIEAGLSDIGESKVQEAFTKHDGLHLPARHLAGGPAHGFPRFPSASPRGERREASAVRRAGQAGAADYACLPAIWQAGLPARQGRRIKWHMVGHLQTNKVEDAVSIFDLIQSVDGLRIAQEINKQAQRLGKIQDVLIEVKTSEEVAKFGLKPDEAIEVIEQIIKFKNINIKGLMTIAPVVDNPEKTRPYFIKLRELRDKISDLRFAICDMQILSMGMSDDFEIAIEEGANMIRLGRAIFQG